MDNLDDNQLDLTNKYNIIYFDDLVLSYIFKFLEYTPSLLLVCKQFYRLYIKTLQQYPIKVTYLSRFTNFKPFYWLNISRCRFVNNFIKNIINHNIIKILDVSYTDISDLQYLTNLYSFTAVDCFNIRQISNLSFNNSPKLSYVNLNGCIHISDLSPLNRNKQHGIKFISLNDLYITNLDFLKVSAGYSQTQELSLKRCIELIDISGIETNEKHTKVNKIYLNNNLKINLCSLKGIQHVYLDSCHHIHYLDELYTSENNNNYLPIITLDISSCIFIKNLSPIRYLKVLYINNCNNDLDLTPLENLNIESLFMNYTLIRKVPTLPKLKVLYIKNCPFLIEINVTKINILVMNGSYSLNLENLMYVEELHMDEIQHNHKIYKKIKHLVLHVY